MRYPIQPDSIQKSKKINHVYVHNTESSLEQYNSFFAFLQKVNNSMATKLCVNLINNCEIFLKYF